MTRSRSLPLFRMADETSATQAPFRSVRDVSAKRVEEFRPAPVAVVAAVVAVAATYVFFLIFAQFGFLRLVPEAGRAGAGQLKALMAVMGCTGLLGSVLMAWRFNRVRAPGRLIGAFGVCGLAAMLALVAKSSPLLFATAALTGLGAGGATVGLAGHLRSVLGGARLGTCLGWGTGLAYGFCNLPAVFSASVNGQVLLAAGAACVGMLSVHGLEARAPNQENRGSDYRGVGLWAWVLVFVALVWLDSAAFYVIQHNAELKSGTWADDRLYLNAGVHLAVAVATGYALDRRWLGRTVVAGAAMLVVAGWLLEPGHRVFAEGTLLYTAGVSVYSTVLVFYPARSARPWIAALVYAVAGWTASGLGIGMAENLREIPPWFLGLAAAVVLAAMLLRLVGRRRAGVVAVILAAGAGLAGTTDLEARETAALIQRGRAVYVREGCTACHSQYVRPGPADRVRWGPARPLAAALGSVPPLLGYRRQGPDLQNLAARRTEEWNRLHLIAPRELSPGSRMPSYAHLFAGGGGEGEALLGYLNTLGAEATAERWDEAQRWRPAPRQRAILRAEQAELFRQWCAPCHGSDGRGDGPLAAHLLVRPRDLLAEAWRFVPAGVDETTALARIIKFGVPGTAMAGREYLPDDEISALATYLRALRVAAAAEMNRR